MSRDPGLCRPREQLKEEATTTARTTTTKGSGTGIRDPEARVSSVALTIATSGRIEGRERTATSETIAGFLRFAYVNNLAEFHETPTEPKNEIRKKSFSTKVEQVLWCCGLFSTRSLIYIIIMNRLFNRNLCRSWVTEASSACWQSNHYQSLG